MADINDILSELAAREPIFHRCEFGTTRAALTAMMDDGFWEIGASGRVYDRAYVIDTMLERYASGPEPHEWPCSDFAIRALGADVFHLSYILHEPDRHTRRSTLWRRAEGEWKIMFHQGTIIAAP